MKKLLSVMLVMWISLSCLDAIAQREIYTNPRFAEFAQEHKVLAIIPFKVTLKLRPKEMERMTEEEFTRLQVDEGIAVQSALHTYYLKRQGQGRTRHDISVQPAATTNALLKQAGITYDNYDEYTPAQLCEILGVDALVHGTMNTSKPMSEGASIALGLVVGFYGPTNTGKISIQISDAQNSELLWKYDKTLSRSLGSDTNTIINNLMKKASKKWPYEAQT